MNIKTVIATIFLLLSVYQIPSFAMQVWTEVKPKRSRGALSNTNTATGALSNTNTATGAVGRATNVRLNARNPRNTGNGEVYLSMTTSPARLSNISPILDYLLRGNNAKGKIPQGKCLTDGIEHEITGVILNIPHHFRNDLRNTYDEQAIKELGEQFGNKIIINRLDHDLGPISKLLPTIAILKGQNKTDALVISIDDDHYYHPKMLQMLIKLKAKNPSYVLSFGGCNISHYEEKLGEREWTFPYRKGKTCPPSKTVLIDRESNIKLVERKTGDDEENAPTLGFSCDMVEGYGAIIYRVGEVDLELMQVLADENLTSSECRLSDDLVISFVLSLHGSERVKLNKGNMLDQMDSYVRRGIDLGFFVPLDDSEGLQHGSGLTGKQKERLQIDASQNNDAKKYREALRVINGLSLYTFGQYSRYRNPQKLYLILVGQLSINAKTDDNTNCSQIN